MRSKLMRAAGLVCVSAVAMAAYAADHKEAPLINNDPAADLNDIYVFKSPNNPANIVMALTVNPFTPVTAGNANRFSSSVRYRLAIDHNNDGIQDRDIQFTFSAINPTQMMTVRLPNGTTFTAPVTLPTTNANANAAVITTNGASGAQVFAGPTDDPFFFDAVGFNRFVRGVGGFSGRDTFAGFNCSTVCIELPVSALADADGVFQVWGVTERQRLTLRRGARRQLEVSTGEWEQVERTGNPAISTALIPAAQKDLFNLGTPNRDATDFAGFIVASLTGLGTNSTNIGILAPIAVPDTLKVTFANPTVFPNGRGLSDDVIDTLLFFIFNQTPVSDGANANDRAFLSTFPYFAQPQQPPA
ncbi:MAG: DUF4331 family protein [Phycisphaerales bacterium]